MHRIFLLAALPLSFATAQSAPQPNSPMAVRSAALVAAQPPKKALGVADYARWRNVEGAVISADGNWVSYVLRFTNTLPVDSKPVLHLLRLDMNKEIEIPNATNGTFSPDSRWIVYQVDSAGGGRGGRGGGAGTSGVIDTSTVSPVVPQVTPTAPGAPGVPGPLPVTTPATAGRGGPARPPAPPRRFELRDLATGKTQVWQDMASAVFSPSSNYLLLKRRVTGAADAGGGRGAGGGGGSGGGAPGGGAVAATGPRGSDAILHDLNSGKSQFLGNVADVSFNTTGELLAYTVDAAVRDGNGLFLIDLSQGRTHVLDNDARVYSRLTWSDDGKGVAVLKGREADKMREKDNLLIAFADAKASAMDGELAAAKLDPTTAVGFPRGWVVSDRATLSWSEDKKRVFFGMISQSAAPDTGRRRSTDSIADVDVWRSGDQRIQSQQMVRAEGDRSRTFRSAFDVANSKFITLADSTMRDLEIAPDGKWAVGQDTREYVSDYKRPTADFYRVNTTTGERTLMFKGQLTGGQNALGISPDGKRFLFWKDNKFQAYDLDGATSKTLGSGAPTSFIDLEYDHPGPKPSYGIAGYTADAKNVVVHGKYDLWLMPLDGTSAVKNLTNGVGTKGEIRFRVVRTAPLDSTLSRRARTGNEIDLSKPVTLSAFGEYTKKAGFSQLVDGQLKAVVYDDAAFNTPIRAAKAEKYLFTRQTFTEFPDLRVSGPDFKDSKKITDANPQQSEYLWGHRVLFDYKNKAGVRLQGMLALPDDYKPGEKRPMIVNFYEKNSQNLNRYSAPSFLSGMGSSPIEGVSRGYIMMVADIYYNTGSSHSDMLDCVEAATRKVIEMGYADPKRIGINGHSYGGEGAAFIGTRSRLFAAVGMGAGVSDLFTDFSQSWGWSYQVTGGSGMNGNDYYLYGQGRWGVSPWEKPELYHFESALTHVPAVTAPFLIMHGTADPTVSFAEGMNMYNALRYNGKNAIMLAYPGEGHGLTGLANRRDLTIRYFQFFDHYLKGASAPRWMTAEVPFLMKDALRDPARP